MSCTVITICKTVIQLIMVEDPCTIKSVICTSVAQYLLDSMLIYILLYTAVIHSVMQNCVTEQLYRTDIQNLYTELLLELILINCYTNCYTQLLYKTVIHIV